MRYGHLGTEGELLQQGQSQSFKSCEANGHILIRKCDTFKEYKDQALPVRPEILLVDRIFQLSEELVIAVACPVIFGFTDFISSLLDLRLLLDFVFLSLGRLGSHRQPCKPTTARVLTTSLETMEFQGHPLGLYPVTGQQVRISDNLALSMPIGLSPTRTLICVGFRNTMMDHTKRNSIAPAFH